MKKTLKVIAFAAVAICLVGVGAFAKGLFAPQASFYYENSLGACVEFAHQTATPIDQKGSLDQPLILQDASGNIVPAYIDSDCEIAAKFTR